MKGLNGTRRSSNNVDANLSVKKRDGKKDRKAKDPNLPKRPPTAFFVFLQKFRETYKLEHPNAKGVTVVGKAGGEKWKAMPEEEKQLFVQKAAELKEEYDKTLAAYKQKQEDEASPDNSKSEINDDGGTEEEAEENQN